MIKSQLVKETEREALINYMRIVILYIYPNLINIFDYINTLKT